MRSMRIVSLLVLLLLTGSAFLAAGEVAGVEMAGKAQAGDQELLLNGMALRSKLMFKVYVAGLYLQEKTSDADAIFGTDAPRHVAMHWLRNVGKDDICKGWDEGLAANTPNASAALQKQFRDLCGYMKDAKKKQVFTFTYLPGKGTEIAIDGKVQGTIEGKEFADALWASWIGPHPGPGEDFKKALLGG